MPRSVARIAGAVLLVAGVATVVLHYTYESDATASWVSFVIAAVLLFAGWALFDRGGGFSRRQ